MIESPCVASCRLNADKVCVGCYRHITEIVDWNKRPDNKNIEILQRVEKRKLAALTQDLSDTETWPITQQEWLAAKAMQRK